MGKNFNLWTLSGWIVEALYCSVILYFFPWAAFQTGMFGDGTVYGVRFMGNVVSVCGITAVNLRMLLETRNVTWFIHLSYIISFLFLVLVFAIETAWFDFFPIQYYMFQTFMSSGIFWLLFILTVVLCLLPALIGKYLVGQCCPWDSQIAREEDKLIRKGLKQTSERREEFVKYPSVTKLVGHNNEDDSDF